MQYFYLCLLKVLKKNNKMSSTTVSTTTVSNSTKWSISAFSAALFFIISSPFIYQLVNMLTSKLGLVIASESGCPNYIGVFVHAIVFMLVVRLFMGL